MEHHPQEFTPNCRLRLNTVEELTDVTLAPRRNGSGPAASAAAPFSTLRIFFGYSGHRVLLTADCTLFFVESPGKGKRYWLKVQGDVSADGPNIGYAALNQWFDGGLFSVRTLLRDHADKNGEGQWCETIRCEGVVKNAPPGRVSFSVDLRVVKISADETAKIFG